VNGIPQQQHDNHKLVGYRVLSFDSAGYQRLCPVPAARQVDWARGEMHSKFAK
jgi:hypothetical protein